MTNKRYKSHQEYIETNDSVIGETPTSWDYLSYRVLVSKVSNGTTAPQLESKTDYPVSRIETISTGEINYDLVGFLSRENAEKKWLLNKGDILLSHINSLAFLGNAAIFEGNVPLYHGMNLLRIQSNINIVTPNFHIYLIRSSYFKHLLQVFSKHAINQVSLSITNLKRIKVALPPLPEQLAIADFLDHQTERIDDLIENKRRLIELLEEKRSAMITQAVTRGLDPDAPMKDSGIEWLGEIPEHWQVTKLKYLSRTSAPVAQTGPFGAQLHASDYVDGGIPLILIKHIINNSISSEDMPTITKEKAHDLRRYRVKENDLIFSRVGSIGRIAQITRKESGWMISGQTLRLRFGNPELSTSFLLYSLGSDILLRYIDMRSLGSTRDSINTEILSNMPAPIPPLEEQIEIVLYLEKYTKNLDLIITKVQESISRLREIRSSLISSAITGQIDVRDWMPEGAQIDG